MGDPHLTAEIVRVPGRPPCWRLVVWRHTLTTRLVRDCHEVHLYNPNHNCAIKEVVDDVASIEDVIETDLKGYHILRGFAKDRGFSSPTFKRVQLNLQHALGPSDSDQGPTVGREIVREWVVLDDERESSRQLKIELGKPDWKILLTDSNSFEWRQIG